ncbi:UNVERIFIED_CONTAM: hypothetical protein HDU68_006243 [Siphonaria sp. JEL0065]|nr:hypothetical protein HDU68_006243 [Siphonaria sp. JEL0065]
MFFTRNAWQCIGGLPGMVLTLADAGAKGITLHGPPGFTHSLAAMRQFLYRPSLPILVKEYLPQIQEPEYKDENLTVKTVFLHPLLPSQPPVTRNENGKRTESLDQPTPRESLRTSQINVEQSILNQMFTNSAGPPVISGHAAKRMKESDKQKEKKLRKEKEAGGIGHPLSENPPSESSKSVGSSQHQHQHQKRANDTSRFSSNRLEPCEKSETVIAYVCKGPVTLGKFNVEAAVALGIPKGKMFGELQRGKSVKLADGRVIEPAQCVAPSKLGPMFIILDCPSVDYIPSIQASDDLKASSHEANPVQCIVHLLGDGVLEHPDFKAWMNSFGDDCQAEITLKCTAKIQHDLNYAENAVFPLPYFTNEAEIPISSIPNLPKLTAAASPLLIYQFEPKRVLDSTAVLPPFERKHDDNDEIFQKFKSESDAIRSTHVFGDPLRPLDTDDMICVPLGTGAAIPAKYRNVSSTYLRFSDGAIFLDAGEGTFAQFYRHYGKRVDEELRLLKCMFISHLHADHHLGAISILKRVYELKKGDANSEPICIVAPAKYYTWLSEYADVEEFGFKDLVFVDSKDLMKHNTWARAEQLRKITNMTQFQTLLVKHCYQAYALVLTHQSGLKIAFSGDCRPSNNFVDDGYRADLVIHEATLADDKMAEAVEKNHCTTNEAIGIAKSMKAKNLLLTHFSQRYPKLPEFDMKKHVAEDGGLAIGVAFDSMRIRLKEFKKLETLYGPLNTLWGAVVEEEEKAIAEGEGVGEGFSG